jgi:hypothetical protein
VHDDECKGTRANLIICTTGLCCQYVSSKHKHTSEIQYKIRITTAFIMKLIVYWAMFALETKLTPIYIGINQKKHLVFAYNSKTNWNLITIRCIVVCIREWAPARATFSSYAMMQLYLPSFLFSA